jgi:hypothetical protein
MNTLSLSIRSIALTLMIFVAVAQTELHETIADAGPHLAGLGRLGRDLVRRPSSVEAACLGALFRLSPLTLPSI